MYVEKGRRGCVRKTEKVTKYLVPWRRKKEYKSQFCSFLWSENHQFFQESFCDLIYRKIKWKRKMKLAKNSYVLQTDWKGVSKPVKHLSQKQIWGTSKSLFPSSIHTQKETQGRFFLSKDYECIMFLKALLYSAILAHITCLRDTIVHLAGA